MKTIAALFLSCLTTLAGGFSLSPPVSPLYTTNRSAAQLSSALGFQATTNYSQVIDYNYGTPTGVANDPVSTFTGWGEPLGIIPTNFNSISMAVYPYDAAYIPSLMRLTLRVQGAQFETNWNTATAGATNPTTWTVLGQGTVTTAGLTLSNFTTVVFPFGTNIYSTSNLWIEVTANGHWSSQTPSSYSTVTNKSSYPLVCYNGFSYPDNSSLLVTNWQTVPIWLPGYAWPVSFGAATMNIIQGISANNTVYDNSRSGLPATNVQIAIDGLATNGAAAIPMPRVIMPDSYIAVVGDDLQIFTRGVIEEQTPQDLPFQFSSTVGNNYPRYWDYIPASNNVGSAALTVNVLNNQGTVVSTAASTITTVAVSSNSPSSNIVVACLGDSLTDAGIWPAEFYRRLTQPGGIPLGLGFSNIQFAGDRPLSGYPSNSFTGWGGWRWLDYTNTATTSAAWLTVTANDKTAADLGGYWQDGNGNQWRLMATNGNTLKVGNISSSISTLGSSGTLTYVSSATHQTSIAYTAVLPAILSPLNNTNSMTFTNIGNFSGFTNVSILYVLLGWNGLAGADLPYATNHTAFQGQAQAVINQLHADYPNAQVRIMGMEVPSPSGGLGANYGATGADANFYELLRTLNGVRLAYQQLCDFPSNSAFCRYVDIAGQFDSDNNMSVIPVVVNSRNSAAEWRGSNGVHPATQGYYQIADAVWRDFVYTYCQGSNYAYSAGSLTPYFNLPIAVSGSLTLTTNNGVPTIGSSAGGGNVLSAGQNNFSGSNWFSGLTTFGLSPVGNGANFTNIGYSSLNLAALNTTGAAAILGYQLGQLGPLGDISFNPGNGNMSVGGTMTATSFTGNAAALTNMSGATIQSGTIPAAALTANSIGSNQLSATITAQLGGGGSVTLSGNNQWSGNQQFNTLTYFTAGASSSGSGLYSEAWGGSAVANGTSGTALGNNANDVSAGGVALGAYATANNVAAIAIGSNATANLNAIAIGQNTTAANNTVVIGGAGTTIFSTPGVITGSGAGLTNLPNLGLSVNFTNVVSGSTIWLSASNGSAQVYAWTNSTEILCPALDNYTKLATFRLTIYSTNAAPTINVAASNCFNGSLMALTATTNIASAFLLDRDSDFNSTNKFTLFRLK